MSSDKVGIIGLGAIGSAFAHRLLQAKVPVVGFDVSEAAVAALEKAGGTRAASPAAVAASCSTVIFSLPSVDALSATLAGEGGIVGAVAGPGTIIDTNTFAVTDKDKARKILADAGWGMIDCTFSGNRDMVLTGDYAFFASGDPKLIDTSQAVLDILSNRVIRLGEFGEAATIKLIVNHLGMVHTAAAAEAMAFAVKAGIDPHLFYNVVIQSAASSGAFELRAKMMADEDYTSSRGNYRIAIKDAKVIADFAGHLNYPTPLFQSAVQMHLMGVAQGLEDQDTASMGTMLERLSSAKRKPPKR
nr:NAD(P)-dependent oxidoreductase [Phenylobacterium sp.]